MMESYHWAREHFLSERVKASSLQLRHSIDTKAAQLSRQGIRIIDLSDETNMGGDLDYVKDAVSKMLHEGLPPGELRGLLSLRTVLAEKEKEEKGLDLDPDSNVMITTGGSMQSLYMAIHATIGPGDEVLVGYPGLTFDEIVKLAGGTPVYFPIPEEKGYTFDFEAIESAITPRTKMIIITSPHNPTGRVFERSELEGIAEIAIRHNLLVLSDEVHEKNVWDNRKHVSIATLPEMQERTIISCSVTKCYHMFRWRVGWVIGNAKLIEGMEKIMMWSCQFPPPLTQAGAEALLTGLRGPLRDWFRSIQRELEERRNLLWDLLNKIDGFVPFKPQGTFLSFTNVGSIDSSSIRLSDYLLEKANVLVSPGIAYLGEGHLRISSDRPKEEINEALSKIKAALENYKK
jgi:aspartate/methionine/tyrosine aminotransferase